MSQPTYAIEGTQLPEGRADPPARQEVTSWINNPDNARQVSLFMRALTEFQRLSPTEDPLSYYRVAGIHGNPDVSWDGVANPPGTTGRSSWWCAHNKETFASWHRPYLVLFEQRIYALMVATIAKNVPNDSQKSWEDAAREWRLPYWDWALTQPYINNLGVPEVFTKDRIDIVDFADNTPPTMESITNPLAKFSNPTGTAMGDQSMGDFALTGEPWSNAIATSRHGIDRADVTAPWVGGVNNWTKSNEAIQGGNGVTSIPDQIYRLFATDLSSWESFSSTKSQPPPRAIDFMSLEAIHNNIHGYTGGRDPGMIGHMGDTSVAAFDPIFWFHHCNVDHLAATFQTLHPDMWYDATTDLASTKLEPFHRDTKATSWTADATRDWKANLRYTYDDLEAPHPPRAFAAFRRLAARTIGRPRTGADNQPDLSLIRRRINEKYGTVQRQIMNSPDILGKENDYVINIIYDRYALDGAPYYIHFFLGDPPPDRDAFTHTDSYVGSMYTFSSKLEDSTNATRCGNCLDQRSEGILSTSQVPLTEAILRSVKHLGIPDLHTMEPDEVETYLQTHLVWRANIAIQEPGGAARSTMIDMSLLPKTKIFAMRGRVHYPESDSELSTYSNYTVMWRATSDKPGGAVESDAQPVS